MPETLTIGGIAVDRGSRRKIELSVAKLFDYTELAIPVEVIRGKQDGPVLFVCAAIHGDEINGVEIIKRLLKRKDINTRIRGTLIAVPIVNVTGFNSNSRYLPDRRDLNRCFPGSEKGSLGGQIARHFMQEIVEKCTHGIDLHTGAIHRSNLPQIRAILDDRETRELAESFGVPVMINSSVRDGSLRQCAAELGIPTLLYEGGEALRYDEKVIKTGLMGILSVMQSLGMIRNAPHNAKKVPYIARSSYWVRAPHSGSLRVRKKLGDLVMSNEVLGVLSDPYGDETVPVHAQDKGIIIGISRIPLVNNGDALFHIASFKDSGAVEQTLDEFDRTVAANNL